MTTEDQSLGILTSLFHRINHFMRLAFEKPATSSDENCVTGEKGLFDISIYLIRTMFDDMIFLSRHFNQINDVTPCVTWCVDDRYLDSTYFNCVSVLDRQGASRNVIILASNNH